MPSLPEWAQWYAKNGRRVFPVGKNKVPFTLHGCLDATTDTTQIEEWWTIWPTANIGVALEASDLVVDFDKPEYLDVLRAEDLDLPATAVSSTSRGLHYWYTIPPERQGEILNRVKPLGEDAGVDTRTLGGYVVAPPSLHQSGVKYKWVVPPSGNNVAEAPDWILDACSDRKPSGSDAILTDSEVKWDKVLDGLPDGKRDDGLYKYACYLRRRGLTRREAEIVIADAAGRCTPPFPYEDAMRKVAQAWKKDGPAEAPDPSTIEYPKLWALDDLMDAKIPEPQWIVNRILPVGLALIVAPPKAGKSFLMGNIALAGVNGTPALGCFDTAGYDALYLDLEQVDWRCRKRWASVLGGNKAPHGMVTTFSWPKADLGGEELLRRYLTENPRTKLVVIDVWAKYCPDQSKIPGDAYHKDYAMLSPLGDLGKEFGAAICLVHHTNKAGDWTNPLSVINGSAAMSGTPDTIWVMQRPIGQNEAKLYVTGKGVESDFIGIEFDPKRGQWNVSNPSLYMYAEAFDARVDSEEVIL